MVLVHTELVREDSINQCFPRVGFGTFRPPQNCVCYLKLKDFCYIQISAKLYGHREPHSDQEMTSLRSSVSKLQLEETNSGLFELTFIGDISLK